MPNELSVQSKSSVIVSSPRKEKKVVSLKQIPKLVLKFHEGVSKSEIDLHRNMVLAGVLLAKAKQILPRGDFRNWVEKSFSVETGLGLRTAQRYMAIARKYFEFAQSDVSICNNQSELKNLLDSPLLDEFARLQLALKESKNAALIDPNEWESPPQVIQAVSEVMDGIDCDPCALANSDIVCAPLNFTPRENGLDKDHPWTDSVWICPGHDTNVLPWWEKAHFEFVHGQLQQAILCLPISAPQLPPELLRRPIAITTTPLEVIEHQADFRRRKFLSCRSLFVYLTSETSNHEKFARAFRDIGVVYDPVVPS